MSKASDPLVTVYITNHNYGAFLQQSIESVLSQSFDDYELIIIDDGSTDNSQEIIARYENHPKIRIILQENKGLNRSNNIALNAARGEYLMRLDADDFLDSQALLVMTNILEANPGLGLVFPDYYYVNTNGDIIGQEKRHDFKDVSLLDQPAHGACTLIRKRCLLGVGGYSESFRCQDGYDLWLRFIEKHDVQNVSLPLFYYRRHGQNLTKNTELILKTRAEIKKRHAERIQKKPFETLAILPVRGRYIDPGCLALSPLGDKLLIDWTVDEALQVSGIKKLIVTSPDRNVLQYVRSRYDNPRIILDERPVHLARENVLLYTTVSYLLGKYKLDFDPQAILILSHELPFRSKMYIEKAINTMRIFDVDSVIPVLPENDLFFQHNGHGLQLLDINTEDGLRFERKYLYRKLLGMSLVTKKYYLDQKRELGGKIGHVVFSKEAAFTVRSSMDLDIANYLLGLDREM
jgi:glycosyltransferase involved in cell wall biosynthesis